MDKHILRSDGVKSNGTNKLDTDKQTIKLSDYFVLQYNSLTV